jgi:hypothetical protein
LLSLNPRVASKQQSISDQPSPLFGDQPT